MANKVETKVVAAAGGSGAGAALATFALWLLGVLVWHVPDSADKAGDAVAAVPSPVAGLILVVVSAAGAAIGGWLAPHTSQANPGQLLVPRVTLDDSVAAHLHVDDKGTVARPPVPAPEGTIQ